MFVSSTTDCDAKYVFNILALCIGAIMVKSWYASGSLSYIKDLF